MDGYVGLCTIIIVLFVGFCAWALVRGQERIESKLDELLKRKDGE